MHGMLHSLLLVEDSSDDEALSLRAIGRCGVPCETVVVRDGCEAINLFSSPEGPVPDLVVLDFHLPGYTGLEVLRQLRKQIRTRFCPVVMLSSLASIREKSDCLSEGASSFVQKPVDPQIYVEHIAMIVRYWLTVDSRFDLGKGSAQSGTKPKSRYRSRRRTKREPLGPFGLDAYCQS